MSFVLQTCNCQDGLLKFLVNRVSWQWIFSLFFFCFVFGWQRHRVFSLSGSTKTVIQLLTATGFLNFQEKKTVKIDRVNSLPSFLINSAGLLGRRRRNCCTLLQLVWNIFGLTVVQHAIWCFFFFYLGLKLARNNLVGITRDTVACCFHWVVVVAVAFISYFYQCFRDDLVSLCWLGNAIARHSLKGRAWGRHRSLTEKKNTSLVRPSRALAVPLGFSSLLLLFAELFLFFSLIL